MDKFITDYSELNSFFNVIAQEAVFPFFVSTYSGKPVEETEHEKWKRLNSFFHRGICPTYSECSGLLPDEAKHDLQMRFALVQDCKDHVMVESISGMSVSRLVEFCEQCQTFLMINFQTRASELLEANRNRFLKLKRISK